MKTTVMGISAAALLVAFVLLWFIQHRFGKGEAVIAGRTIPVEIASTMVTRAKGLSGRQSLPDDTGMVFLFPLAGKHAMWMPDMRFSIDILWVREGKIVDIAPGVQPMQKGEAPRIYEPRLAADMVVELPAGYAVAHDVHIGDTVEVRKD